MTLMENEYQMLRNRFIYRMRDQEIKSGKKPKACIMGEADYCALQFLAREECTITDMNLSTDSDCSMMYYGVQIYQSVGLTDMVFGS